MQHPGRDGGNGHGQLEMACRVSDGDCEPDRRRVVGEIIARKPVWKSRRANENDEELLQLLAHGLGRWFAARICVPSAANGNGADGSIVTPCDGEALRNKVAWVLRKGNGS